MTLGLSLRSKDRGCPIPPASIVSERRKKGKEQRGQTGGSEDGNLGEVGGGGGEGSGGGERVFDGEHGGEMKDEKEKEKTESESCLLTNHPVRPPIQTRLSLPPADFC